MIDWDAFFWAQLTGEELEAWEARLQEEYDWLMYSREAEQSLTGQEP